MSIGEFFKSVLRKLTSVKLWITAWAMVMSSWLIVTRQSDFMIPLIILLAVPLSFMGINVIQDYIFNGVKK